MEGIKDVLHLVGILQRRKKRHKIGLGKGICTELGMDFRERIVLSEI